MTEHLSRRGIISAGAAGLALTAGCLGGTRSTSGSSGEDTSSDGSTISITSFPLNVDGLTNYYIDDSGILEEELSSVGYEYDMQLTFEGPPQFVSGKTDVAHDISALEAARLTQEQDMDLAVLGRIQTAFMGMHVVPGSEWDPENTGSVQATLDKAADEGGKVGILGWGVGDVPPTQLLMERLWGKKFYQDETDFEVVTSQPSVMPKLIADGELAMGSISATHGAANELLNDELKPIYFGADMMRAQGWGTPPLSDVVTTQEFLEENRDACEAIVRALDRGTDWVHSEALDEVGGDSELQELLITQESAPAEYALQYHTEPGTKYSPDGPTLWEDNYVTDDWVEDTKTALRNAQEVDQLGSGWEDKLEFVTF
jgi:ABC-type nitrate/sulfonate/bicarbonate transport system substrate-binding protein